MSSDRQPSDEKPSAKPQPNPSLNADALDCVRQLNLQSGKSQPAPALSDRTPTAERNQMVLKPHARLTSTLRLLLKIMIVITAVAALAGLYDFYSYATLSPNVNLDVVMLPSDAVTGFVGLIQFVFVIATGITFLCWIYRSNKNLRTLSGESMTFTSGWSVGWYFVPIANLFKPYQVMKEIWNVSHKNDAAGHIVGWWWGLWLISKLLGHIAFRLFLRADDADGYAASALAYTISDSLDFVLYRVTLNMVTRIGAAYSKNIVEPSDAAYGASATVEPKRSPLIASE